jgi:AcrR family transcriptional regulator
MGVRTRLSLDERRERLVASGLELFGTRPYETISVDEIAAAAGISRGLLYHYFPGKREFYVEVVRAAVDELIKLIEPDPSLPPAEQLRASLHAYFDFVLRRRAGYLAVTRGGGPEVVAETDRVRDRVVELVLAGAREPLSGSARGAARLGRLLEGSPAPGSPASRWPSTGSSSSPRTRSPSTSPRGVGTDSCWV